MKTGPRERFILTLEAVPDPEGIPAPIRLRRLLKTAWRRDRLKCVKIVGDQDKPAEEKPPCG